MNAAGIASRLKGAKRGGKGWSARCPAHDDANASLSISDGDRGVVLHCHAGCSPEQVVGALGLSMADLFADRPAGGTGSSLQEVARYPYTDEHGTHLFDKIRYLPKTFRQQAADGSWSLDGVRRVLYRLPDVIDAVAMERTVFVCEGEKDCDRLAQHGLPATTNPEGAGKWRSEYSETLRDADVVIVPDNDDPGREHARVVAAALQGIARRVRVLELPGLPDKGDVSDWLDAGHNGDDLLRLVESLSSAPDSGTPAFATLAELMANPDMLAPPQAVIKRLAYRSRLLMLAGPDKSGKSTLMAHASSCLTRGDRFLGEPTEGRTGRVVLLGLEEAAGDAVRRYAELNAAPERVQIVTTPTPDLLAQTNALLKDWPADLLIVDSLQEYARVTRGTVPDDGDNASWSAVVRPLVALAREHEIAIVVLHHVRRSDGQYRGAGEIAAAADALLEMSLPSSGEDPNLRRIKGRGRWTIEPFAVTLRDGKYELSGGGTLSMDARVLLYIEQNEGASRRGVRQGVGGRATAVDAAIDLLLKRGAIVNLGTEQRPRLYTPTGQTALEVAA